MTVKITKPEINIREKLSELDYGHVPYEKMPAGSVVQVQHQVYDPSGSQSVTGTSWTDTGLTLDFYPKRLGSKIIIFWTHYENYIGTEYNGGKIRVVRSLNGDNATQIGNTSITTLGYLIGATTVYFNLNGQVEDDVSYQLGDKLTYKTQFADSYSGKTFVIGSDNTDFYMTVMEIAQ